ncbi:uncharacterized protein LOC126890699 [Diabrotica virgifera virgifera]|uniref:HAT C-terminal dimerisation domain-containing protein n=1 Tax=Diabrotica virgifera virgifera TaxID=50390 RepID=A0ABM5L046_DIAVI|nr:uncharacterized protein LOC126890699 [Diabrotica virgifera virgifera]
MVCLKIIAHYSSQLEPITNKLQGVSVNLLSVKKHIGKLLEIFQNDRNHCEVIFSEIFKAVVESSKDLNIEIVIPRLVGRQTHRANVNGKSAEEYFRISIFNPYLDSLISSLKSRFSEDSNIAFSLSLLHPIYIEKDILLNSKDIKNIAEKYSFENFEAEYSTWVSMWKMKPVTMSENVEFMELLIKNCEYYPAIAKTIKIFLSIPPTTCSVERSFSTLRRVKTWLRSTMTENRLSGLCMISVHRKIVNLDKQNIISQVIDIFGSDRRNLKFLFSE